MDTREWLIRLGMLTASNMTAADVKAKVAAFLPLLNKDFSPDCFSEASLHHCARALTYYPAYAELHAALTEFRRLHPPPRPALPAPDGPERAWWPAVEARTGGAEFRHWIAPLREVSREIEPVRSRSGAEKMIMAVTLAAPTPFHADYVRQHHAVALQAALGARVRIVAAAEHTPVAAA